MKLFYVCPHLSTGGQPQYTLKMIESFKYDYNIKVIEVNNYSDEYTVQRKAIQKQVTLHQSFGNQHDVLDYIKSIEPDIIHFQELPESFLSNTTLKELYKNDRSYFIIVTTHSSLTKPEDFKFIPDKIIAVNEWQKERLKSVTDINVWEYPIENLKPTEDEKQLCRQELEHFSFWESGKHILNVGLFTPGKNQAELIEIARNDPKNHYHFVGNMAPNFKEYWEPLLANRPENCYFWGERNDTDKFYKACDEFYFTSKFELNPLVVKEALSYGLPVKMRKLDTYGNFYDNNPLVTYI
jgi:glycosyltransferase involved in cell wall biosynthesis